MTCPEQYRNEKRRRGKGREGGANWDLPVSQSRATDATRVMHDRWAQNAPLKQNPLPPLKRNVVIGGKQTQAAGRVIE